MAEGVQHSRRRHRQLQFIKLYKTNGELCFSLSTKRYKYFFFLYFEKRKSDAITHSLEIYSYSLTRWCQQPAAWNIQQFLKWRDGNSMSSPITATFTFTVIICYCLVCLCVFSCASACFGLCAHGTFNVLNIIQSNPRGN